VTLTEAAPDKPAEGRVDNAKRREILEGARRVFRASGFDGASMGEIAKAAGVSKATLYVYFDSKVSLFEELVETDRHATAERLFTLDETDADVRSVLYRLALSFQQTMTRPEQIAMTRMVIGAAEKFPTVGRRFFNAGPEHGMRRLAAYLAAQVAAGRLVIDDVDRAALQFLNLAHGRCAKALLFAASDQPSEEEFAAVAKSAVEVFFAAYGPRGT
jgi:AcrR family transcriptional regulator